MRQEQFTELKNEVPREGFKGMQVPWWHGRYRRKLKILFKSCVRCFARRRTSLPLWPRGSAYVIQMAKRRNGGPPLLSIKLHAQVYNHTGPKEGSCLSGGEVSFVRWGDSGVMLCHLLVRQSAPGTVVQGTSFIVADFFWLSRR